MRSTSNISAARKAEDARNRAACVPPIWSPPANPKRFGNGTTIKYGVAIPDSRPQPTVEMQGACRGEFPRVYWARDYNHERGEFPRVEKTKPQPKPKIDRANEQARETLKRLTKLYKGELEFKDGNLVEVEKIGKPKGNGSPHHTAWKELNAAVEAGNVDIAKTPPIPRSDILTITEVYPTTPAQTMRRAIRDAIHIAPLASEWRDDKETLALPFGMKLGRKGGTEVAVWGSYRPKGSKHKVGTKSVVVGCLKGDRFVPIEDILMFERALSQIMDIVKEHGLNRPTPPPTSPASNPVERAA